MNSSIVTVPKNTPNGRLRPENVKGLIMVLIGSSLWGLSGTAAQVLFDDYRISSGWLVSERLILAGVLFLLIEVIRGNTNRVFKIWISKAEVISILTFGLFGMLGVQLSYFLAIQYGNAATATLLQYLSPVFIIIYTGFRYRRMPMFKELTAAGLAMIGTFLLVTNGSLSSMNVSVVAVLWGLGSAIALAFYTIFPHGLLSRHGASVVTGWGMLVGGVVSSVYYKPWSHMSVFLSIRVDLLTLFVVIFGTFLAFYLYLDSLRLIPPTQASLLSCAEPLSASIVSLLWLHVHMGLFGLFGAACIVGTVVVLSLNIKPKERSYQSHV
ncbi:MAG: EamA family transporter [Bacilli bacterium]